MSGHTLHGASWKPIKQLHVISGGNHVEGKEAYSLKNSIWVPFYTNTKEVILANATNVVASSLFTLADWQSSATKRIVIPSGVVIGSSNTGIAALRTGTGAGGTVEIVVEGEIQGAGGALNGGAGGLAFLAEQAALLELTGAIRAGGGGGGYGGAGGGGYYHSTEDSGWQYSSHTRTTNQWGYYNYFWGGTYLGSGGGSKSHGGYTYYTGAQAGYNYQESGDHEYYYYIKRTRTLTHYTSGGAGGAGGRGQGYGQALTGGSAGAGGGTNAGAGGTGGTGGNWGSSGSTGATGAAGNNGGGAGGASGGGAGAAISGLGHLTLSNSGTINGPQV